MKYNIIEQFNCIIIDLKGNILGGPHAEKFRDELHTLLESGKSNIILNLGKVKFMNSSGLGILVGALTTIRNAGGHLIICEADKKIVNLLMITQLMTVFQHYRSQDEAVKTFQR
ncbi:MAG: STAS domain-containing protein [Balneolaceae bacterium]|nr:STAS domain-containing protein [Balneolaceae bacterium]